MYDISIKRFRPSITEIYLDKLKTQSVILIKDQKINFLRMFLNEISLSS